MKKDYLNLKTLLQLCDSNGVLPNNFDQGIESSNWFIIYLHNIKSYQTFEIWEEFLPYLERTYLAGKIDNDCFLGIGASIKEKIHIKSNVVIGANSFVNKNCLKSSKYLGIPAKKK